MSKKLTGLNPLAYMGVEPTTPSNTININRNPTTNDFTGFNVGDVWCNIVDQQVWIYMGQNDMREAQWIEMASSSGVGASNFVTDSGTAVDLLGTINILGGSNIATDGSVPNTVTIDVDDSPNFAGTVTAGTGFIATTGNITVSNGNIEMANASTDGTIGVYTVNSQQFLYGLGADNVFLGQSVGNLTSSGTANSALGSNSGTALTTGSSNTIIGSGSLTALTSGGGNVALGPTVGNSLESGSFNLLIGSGSNVGPTSGFNIVIGPGAGTSLLTNESSNILIGNFGVATDQNIIRLGTTGSGSGEQEKCFIAGIVGVTTDVNDAIPVLIDSAGQLGTMSSSRVYKENIIDMRSQSEAILGLRPVTFSFKKDEHKSKRFGLIAEEVHEIMPELVVYSSNGNPETVKYHDLIPLMLNEIQRLHNRLASIEDKCSCNCSNR